MRKTLENLFTRLHRLIRGEGGQDLAEYGLMVAMVALVCISGMQGAASSVNQAYGQVAQALDPSQQQQSGQPQPSPAPAPPPPSHHHHGGGGGGGWWRHR